MAKQRLDVLLVELNLCNSRALAQRLIQAGEVMVNQQVVDKPGTEVDVSAEIKIKERSRFVSRGGEKLAKALDIFAISVTDRICLDGGISTGGFTDCLLQAGAKLVYGVDVGYGQVDWKLRNHPRVILRERANLRYLTPAELYTQKIPLGEIPEGENKDNLAIFPDLAVVDVSFISLTKVLPAIWQLTQFPKEALLLVKPQFEVGKNRVGKKGVVRDINDQAEAIFHVLQTAQEIGWYYQGLTWSPITGPAGNIEYLLWLSMVDETVAPDLESIKQLTKSAATSFQEN
ncbi:TlyA family RNA methyltransferase [Calothrix sp. 336/3]|uniref:TlyA family RNA methyltransferase n=1 Tax=Calothrix sp. 336/3 TaxID=1337936 RepID=UPI0004E3A03B|nr:TlyA family RNA methyltransferase [Calothrix sp. 336/3]AKG24848.1 hemolysin [Calothrix sp. 336/3]